MREDVVRAGNGLQRAPAGAFAKGRVLGLYSSTLFLSAALVFSIQPMVGKMLLPRLGGTPAVWNTCMVFFQAALFLGYAYAHWTTKVLGLHRQIPVHVLLVLLPLLVLPVCVGGGPESAGHPNLWLLTQLALSVGLPFFVLSTSAPLLQKWFARLGSEGSQDPYFLYAVSNAGSLLALLSYPFLLEPRIGLVAQSRLWSHGYQAFIVLLCGCALVAWRVQTERRPLPGARGKPVSHAQRGKWLLLSFIPSSLMLGVTTHITTDVAPMPLLWVLPLALYLLSFILAFARKPVVSCPLACKLLVFALIGIALFFGLMQQPWLAIAVHLVVFLVVCMAALSTLARSRPGAEHLTEFYLWLSLGGVLGGLFNSLIAPAVFDSVAEYPLVLAASAFLLVMEGERPRRRDWMVLGVSLLVVAVGWAGIAALDVHDTTFRIATTLVVPALLCFALRKRPLAFALGVAALLAVQYATASEGALEYATRVYAGRNFFGVKRVYLDPGRGLHVLVHGRTVHGCQKMHPPDPEPLAYYGRTGPVGDALGAMNKPDLQVAVVGLGAGAIASYVRPGQSVTFYEIDPEVITVAQEFFTYLRDCSGRCAVMLGDARIELAKAADGQFDLIVLDAFSSDFVPTHLLTREAIQLYVDKLRAGGVLAFHISSNCIDLAPMLAELAKGVNMRCFSRIDYVAARQEREAGKMPSHYVVMTGTVPDFVRDNPSWSPAAPAANVTAWRDDYTNILSVLRR